MGLLNRKKSKAPRAARTTRSKRQPKSKKSRVVKAGKQILDSYTGGAFSTLTSRNAEGKKRRRMNVGNARAARRAAARVKGTIRMLERLKKSLPHVTSRGKVTTRKARR